MTGGEEELRRRLAAEAREPFDLTRAALLRARLFRVSAQDHVFACTMHHIAFDGWSLGVLTRELSILYTAARNGAPADLPVPPVQYVDYAAWQRGQLTGARRIELETWWRRTLADAPTLHVPTDRPRPAQVTFDGDLIGRTVDRPLADKLLALADRHDATLFTVLMAGLAVLLHRHSGQHDLVVGVPSANRTRPELDASIGFFVNMLALRVAVSAEASLADLLRDVHRRVMDATTHQELPFESGPGS